MDRELRIELSHSAHRVKVSVRSRLFQEEKRSETSVCVTVWCLRLHRIDTTNLVETNKIHLYTVGRYVEQNKSPSLS